MDDYSYVIVLQIGTSGWLTGRYSYRCQPVDYSNHPKTLRVCVILKKKYINKFYYKKILMKRKLLLFY